MEVSDRLEWEIIEGHMDTVENALQDTEKIDPVVGLHVLAGHTIASLRTTIFWVKGKQLLDCSECRPGTAHRRTLCSCGKQFDVRHIPYDELPEEVKKHMEFKEMRMKLRPHTKNARMANGIE